MARSSYSIIRENVRNAKPIIQDIVQHAAEAFVAANPGYRVEAFSGKEGRSRGTKNHPAGNAIDVQIVDPSGNVLPSSPARAKAAGVPLGPAFRQYEQLAQFGRAYQQQAYPQSPFRWGGYFQQGVKYDLMHMDITSNQMALGSWEGGLNNKKAIPGATSIGMASPVWAGQPQPAAAPTAFAANAPVPDANIGINPAFQSSAPNDLGIQEASLGLDPEQAFANAGAGGPQYADLSGGIAGGIAPAPIDAQRAQLGEIASRMIATHPEMAGQVRQMMRDAGMNVDGSPLDSPVSVPQPVALTGTGFQGPGAPSARASGSVQVTPQTIRGGSATGGGFSPPAGSAQAGRPIPVGASVRAGEARGSVGTPPSARAGAGTVRQTSFPGKEADDYVASGNARGFLSGPGGAAVANRPIVPNATRVQPTPAPAPQRPVPAPAARASVRAPAPLRSVAAPTPLRPVAAPAPLTPVAPPAPIVGRTASVMTGTIGHPGKEKDDIVASPAATVQPRRVPTVAISAPPLSRATATFVKKPVAVVPAPVQKPAVRVAAPPPSATTPRKPIAAVAPPSLFNTVTAYATQAAEAAKKAAVHTFLSSDPIKRASAFGVPGTAGFWNNLDTSSPTSVARASLASGARARAGSGLTAAAPSGSMPAPSASALQMAHSILSGLGSGGGLGGGGGTRSGLGGGYSGGTYGGGGGAGLREGVGGAYRNR